MPLSGKGMLITVMDADPAEEEDFNKWYDREHIVERVAIAGFLEARRYVAALASPKYLLYQPAETLTHARILRVRARLPYPIGPLDVFAMAVSVVARAG
jgi:hypothetical protein